MSNLNLPSGWTTTTLGTFMDFKNGVNADKGAYGKGIKFVNVMDIFRKNCLSSDDVIGSVEITDKQLNEYSVVRGDILFNRTSETPEEIAFSSVYLGEEKITFGGFVIRGRQTKQLLLPEFAKYCFKTDTIRKEMIRRSQGAVRANIGQKDLSKVPIVIPPETDQKMIVSILDEWGHMIEKTEALVDAKECQFGWLVTRLLDNKSNDLDWDKYSFGDIFSPFKEVNKNNEDLEVLSVTKDGIVSQSEYFNKEVASEDKSKYLIVRKGSLVMSGLNFWMGSIDFQDIRDVGIVSPAYKTFKINSGNFDERYLRFFVRSKYMRKILMGASVQGASVVRRNLDKDMLVNSAIHLPPMQKQKEIAELLGSAEKEITLLKKLADQYRTQKRGLMQKLLSGEWHIKNKEAA